MSRRAAAVAALLLFAGFVGWLFPTDVVVRYVLARAMPPGGPAVVFDRAGLGPRGIVLDDVSVRTPAGVTLARGERVRLMPSLGGLVRGTGLPWHVTGSACGGRLDARVAGAAQATGVTLTFDDADLATCPLLPIAAGALAGRAHGAVRLTLAANATPEGDGHVDVDAGQWRGGGLLQALGTLHVESASVRWTLRDGRLALDALDLRGPELTATGTGAVELADPFPESAVQVTLALATEPAAPPPMRLLLGPPGTSRRVAVGGTLARPSTLVQ